MNLIHAAVRLWRDLCFDPSSEDVSRLALERHEREFKRLESLEATHDLSIAEYLSAHAEIKIQEYETANSKIDDKATSLLGFAGVVGFGTVTAFRAANVEFDSWLRVSLGFILFASFMALTVLRPVSQSGRVTMDVLSESISMTSLDFIKAIRASADSVVVANLQCVNGMKSRFLQRARWLFLLAIGAMVVSAIA